MVKTIINAARAWPKVLLSGLLATCCGLVGAQSLSLPATQSKLARLAASDSTSTLVFPLDSSVSAVLLNIVSPMSDLQTAVELPGGVIVNPASAAALGGSFVKIDSDASTDSLPPPFGFRATQYVYRLPVSAAGNLTVRATRGTAPAVESVVSAQVVMESPVVAQALVTQPDPVVGRPVVFSAIFRDGNNPVIGATVRARIVSPTRTVTSTLLRDDGLAGDGLAGDGIYSTVFVPKAPGSYVADVELSGTVGAGSAVRHSAAAFDAVAETASLSGTVRGRGVDLNGNGALDLIAVDADFSVLTPGRYRVNTRLANGERRLTASGSVEVPAGAAVITAQWKVRDLVNQGLGQGPYQVEAVELLFEDAATGTRPADRRTNLGTLDFRTARFEKPPIQVPVVKKEAARDFNGNGLFDDLALVLVLEAQIAGEYDVSLRLSDGLGAQIAFTTVRVGLLAGTPQDFVMSFAGADIGRSGISGPYAIDALMVAGMGQSLVQPGTLAVTAAYSYTEFENATRSPTDVNNDGRTDCLDYQAVLASFKTSTGQPGFNPWADINRDGTVNVLDMNAVLDSVPASLTCRRRGG